VEIRLVLFGGFAAERSGGQALALPTRKAEALLTILACRAGETQSRERLMSMLWSDRADPQARHSLSQTLTSIRRALGAEGVLAVERDTVTLTPGSVDADVASFQQLATSDALADLRVAADLYRGPFLDGFKLRDPAFDDWLVVERARLHELAVIVMIRLAKGLAAARDPEAAIAALDRAIALDPLAEEAYRQRMRLDLERGAYNSAVRHYRQCADALKRELNTIPEPSTTAIYREAMSRLEETSEQAAADPAALNGNGHSLPPGETMVADRRRKASLAVMPFLEDVLGTPIRGGMADGLTHDIITRLAKLRSLFVIARGTVFALHKNQIGLEEAGRMLKVDYVASGSVKRQNGRITVTAELAETKSFRIIWTQVFDQKLDDAFLILDEIGNQIVAAIAKEIESTESSNAILRPPNSLDAWEAYHRGLWHMYRFTKTDNDAAQHFFEMATQLDPAFSRPYSGLSFTHFQNVFLHRTPEREQEIDRAYRAASQGLFIDEQDPAAHWAMGRAQWLRGCEEESLRELDLSVHLSPNFALGHYTLAFVHCQSGDPKAALGSSDYSRRLSPFDPMLFGMLATRALGLVRLGRFEEAADWATKAAARPNAHAHILGITANCLAAAGRFEEARTFTAAIHGTLPDYGIDDFLTALRFAPDTAALFRKNARSIGLA
jgi:DNA-binding SARP family transcriptional activator